MAKATKTVDEQTPADPAAEAQEQAKTQVQAVEFPEAQEAGKPGAGTSIDVLLDMTVPITVVIDETEVSVQQVLQLGPGSVLKLNKSVETPVDLYLKDVKFATASVVVIEDRFAVRIKEILAVNPEQN